MVTSKLLLTALLFLLFLSRCNKVLNIAKRLGIKTQSNKNGKQNAQKLDASEYLFSTEANKQHLNKAINYVENNGKLIEVDLDDLKNQLLK